MMKTLILTSHVEHLEEIHINAAEFDAVICADGGLLIAEALGISADSYIGDYDSCSKPEREDIIVLPMEKDMTDSEAAIDLAAQKGARWITVLGGIGGRFDHTMGNLGMLAKYCGKLQHLSFMDGQNYIFMLPSGQFEIPKNNYKYLGLISYSPYVSELTITGVKYPLSGHKLDNHTTLGVSNEITADSAKLSFIDGQLLVILSKDLQKK